MDLELGCRVCSRTWAESALGLDLSAWKVGLGSGSRCTSDDGHWVEVALGIQWCISVFLLVDERTASWV